MKQNMMEVIGNLCWSSTHHPEGILLKQMTTTHLKNAIKYIKHRIQAKGDIVSPRQRPFKYSEWEDFMSLYLLKLNPKEEVEESFKNILERASKAIGVSNNLSSDRKTKTFRLLYPNAPTKTECSGDKSYIRYGGGGSLVDTQVHNGVRQVALKRGMSIKDVVNEALIYYLNENKEPKNLKALPPAKVESASTSRVYIKNKKDGEFATVSGLGITFTLSKKNAHAFKLEEALSLKNILNGLELDFIYENYTICRGKDYLTRQEGWVAWTDDLSEADHFETIEEASRVIEALKIVLGSQADTITVNSTLTA